MNNSEKMGKIVISNFKIEIPCDSAPYLASSNLLLRSICQ